jgi:hypothetical protein
MCIVISNFNCVFYSVFIMLANFLNSIVVVFNGNFSSLEENN